MGYGAWHSVSRLGDMLGCREWGWLGGRRPRHVCRSEYQSVWAGTSVHTLQAHSWEALRIRDDSKGQHFRHLQVLLWEEPSACPAHLVIHTSHLRSLKLWPFQSPCQRGATQCCSEKCLWRKLLHCPIFNLATGSSSVDTRSLEYSRLSARRAISHLCCLGLKHVGTTAACPGGSGGVLSPKASKWPCSHWLPLPSHVPALPAYLLGFGCY